MLGRVITSFTVADSFEDDGMEWIRLTVVGQSFVMHQIRKMVRVGYVSLPAAVPEAPSKAFSGFWAFASSFSPRV